MLLLFKSKALRRLFETSDGRGLKAEHLEKIELILAVLHSSDRIEGFDFPSFRLYPLKGDLSGFWAATVRAKWRIVFRFAKGEASEVDLIGHH